MPSGRPVKPVVLTDEEKAQLLSLAKSRSLPHGLVRRARIVLACAEGESNISIARRMHLNKATVANWRKRYLMDGIEGLHDELGRGRRRTYEDERVAETLNIARCKPNHATVRPIGVCVPWARKPAFPRVPYNGGSTCSASNPTASVTSSFPTPLSLSRKCAISWGFISIPPTHAVVLCVDEKTQVQALNRTQPMLPMGLGYVEGVTHDYVRHGTTTLFAALDIATGQVMAQCKKRHRHQEFLAFLGHIDASVPEPFDIHIIADNYATHKHPKVKAWLAKRPRYHIHFTPTYASWLNQVERWFGLITQMAIRRGSFSTSRSWSTKSNASSISTTPLPLPSSGPPPPIPSWRKSSACAPILQELLRMPNYPTYLRDMTLVRTVPARDAGLDIDVVVDFLMPRDAEVARNDPPLIGEFAVQRAHGADLALQFSETVFLDGEMPGGGKNGVHLPVASIPALLVMKGYAIDGRQKRKDAYDIHYCIRNFPGGLAALVAATLPLLEIETARQGYHLISTKFRDMDDFGPDERPGFRRRFGCAW